MEKLWKELSLLIKGATSILYHIAVVAVSAAAALSIPLAASFLAQDFIAYWSVIQNDEVALVSLEIAVAIMLIACINYLRRSIRDRKISQMARDAGFAYFFQNHRPLTQRSIKRAKKRHGVARNIMIIGSTGGRTFADPGSDLHHVLKNCLEAKILLLNPYSEAARGRERAILSPDGIEESFQEQVRKSIEFLKQLRAEQKSVTLRLYSDPPHVKLAILGDYIWLQHYHASRDVHTMPEYVFRHNQNDHGLYAMFYQYFIKRWESLDVPEYDFETAELVYRTNKGDVAKRERFVVETNGSDHRNGVATVEART